jgi:hypothetical protein
MSYDNYCQWAERRPLTAHKFTPSNKNSFCHCIQIATFSVLTPYIVVDGHQCLRETVFSVLTVNRRDVICIANSLRSKQPRNRGSTPEKTRYVSSPKRQD